MEALQLNDDLLRQFEAGLARLRYELKKNLYDKDPLDKDQLNSLLSVFNDRLIIFQHEFLEFLARVKGAAKSSTTAFDISMPSDDRVPEMAASIIAGGAGALLVALIPVGTSGFWIWASTVTAAASIGAAIGVPAGVVTAGAGIVVGAGAGVATAFLLKRRRRELTRKVILDKFDKEVAPRLRTWVASHIQEAK